MNTDICKLLYPSRIYCFSERQLYCYQVAVYGHVFPVTKKLDVKYSTGVFEIKSLTCSLLPPLNFIDCVRTMMFSLKLSLLTLNFYRIYHSYHNEKLRVKKLASLTPFYNSLAVFVC